MRKLVAVVVALSAALVCFVVSSPSASAFGGEVLGCSAGFSWTANACHDSKSNTGRLVVINFSPANTSGTYSTSWQLTDGSGTPITQTCNGLYTNTPCISGGADNCIADAMTCQVVTVTASQLITAALTLIQSGQIETVTAQATIWDRLS